MTSSIRALVLFLALLAISPAAATPRQSTVPESSNVPNVDQFRAELLKDINDVRIDHDLPTLKPSCTLECIAQWHSKDMHVRDYFDHVSPSGDKPSDRLFSATGQRNHMVAENLAGGFQDPAKLVDAWMHSEGHRANLLRAGLHFAGIGVYEGSAGPKLPRGYLVTLMMTAQDIPLLPEKRHRCPCADEG